MNTNCQIIHLLVQFCDAISARVCQLNDHTIMTRTVIFSDFNITPPGFDPTQEEYVRDRVQVSVRLLIAFFYKMPYFAVFAPV